MPNSRHHIHVICTAHDQSLLLDSVAVFFQKTAFLTYDVTSQLSQASFYNRQNIENCDYAVVVVGDNYGASTGVFVSQMHLSYLSAKAKLKPMLILIKTHDDSTQLSWQLLDFIRLVERQSSHIYYYNDSTDIDKLLSYANKEILEKSTITTGWVRQSHLSNTAIIKKAKLNPFEDVSLKNNESSSHSSKGELSYLKASDRSHSAEKRSIESFKRASDTVRDVTTKTSSHYQKVAAKNGSDTDTLTTAILLTDTVDIMYSAQAYEGGNLSDVTLSTTFTWRQILTALATIPLPFSNYGLQNCLNRLIADNVQTEIKAQMPNVHAVSRCKIAEKDFALLQRLLIAANWIQIVASATRTTQELWNLTFYAKQLYDAQL